MKTKNFTEGKTCQHCKNSIASCHQIELNCFSSHKFCLLYLREYILKGLQTNETLLCPNCPDQIPASVLQKVLLEDYRKYFFQCECCSKFIKRSKLIPLPCKHELCHTCLRKDIYNCEKSFQIKCPVQNCFVLIPPLLTIEIIDKRLKENLLAKDYSLCLICKKNKGVELTQCCERKLCKECLNLHVQRSIKKHEKILCPNKKCESILDLNVFVDKLDEPTKQIINARTYNENQNQTYLDCNGHPHNKLHVRCDQCKNNFEMNMSSFLNCKHHFCMKCLASSIKRHLEAKEYEFHCLNINCEEQINPDIITCFENPELSKQYQKVINNKNKLKEKKRTSAHQIKNLPESEIPIKPPLNKIFNFPEKGIKRNEIKEKNFAQV